MDLNGEGVFPYQFLHEAIDEEWIVARDPFKVPGKGCLQPASLDLRLGEKVFRLRSSFLPDGELVADKLERLAMYEFNLGEDGVILERNSPYLIPLMEQLRLPSDIRARANPKSSIGRLDVFTRVITERGQHFDEVAPGYQGQLYLEVVSRSFTIKVPRGLSMNQLRLARGRPRLSDEALERIYGDNPIWFLDGEPVSPQAAKLSDGLFLSLDLRGGPSGLVGYRARQNSHLLDLTKRSHDPAEFWEPVYREANNCVVLEPEAFYLLISREGVCIRPEVAAEMTAYDPTSGELRTHYAGFFDPGFGFDQERALEGSRAVLEVRAHDVPFMIDHGQRVCKLQFERMLQGPKTLYGEEIGSSYQGQNVMLSKFFRQDEPTQPSLPMFGPGETVRSRSTR